MDSIIINNYILETPLKCENSGFSRWGIGTLSGQPYFIKEFLSPVYPAAEGVYTAQKKEEKIKFCQRFTEEKKKLYIALRDASDGHLVVVEQFFRVDAKYYISTKAVTERSLSVDEINRFSYIDRLRLCCAVAHAMMKVHEQKIVHADIKPDNILVVQKESLWPYIIDFDCSFFEDKCPKLGEELNGDMVYLSPEGYLHIAGIESNLSCKMDVFALGLLFCQYLTGSLPSFDHTEYQYPYESVLDDKTLGLDNVSSDKHRMLIGTMLRKEPEQRPDMQFVFKILKDELISCLKRDVIPQNTNRYFRVPVDI